MDNESKVQVLHFKISPSYYMNTFLLLISLYDELQRIMNFFWWGGGRSTHAICWKSWDSLCFPKKYGGMGFKKLRNFNIAMMCK